MARRKVFAGGTNQSEPVISTGWAVDHAAPASVLDNIRVAPARRDLRQRDPVACYRDFPLSLKRRIETAAGDLGVNVGELARYLLEWSLGKVINGELELAPALKSGKRTLYPSWGAERAAQASKGRREKRDELVRVSYRGVPVETAQAVKSLATAKTLPVSEAARWMLECGLDALESGALRPAVYEVQAKNGLYKK